MTAACLHVDNLVDRGQTRHRPPRMGHSSVDQSCHQHLLCVCGPGGRSERLFFGPSRSSGCPLCGDPGRCWHTPGEASRANCMPVWFRWHRSSDFGGGKLGSCLLSQWCCWCARPIWCHLLLLFFIFVLFFCFLFFHQTVDINS